ncbi:thermonuclease family protein [Noviherbaspirillum sp.]|uniref:thermonuclease family protein n=1 Tax=Noviherbaspirillum sp. TaxID=1926288 RepID=UPI002B47A541|nr:thermonuclease family protein [Noviherbaspirillum sp.]HJV80436.1 thermonuclease family protein [Noviherbaspirillum sp.]
MKLFALLFALAPLVPAYAHKVIGVADGANLTLLVDEQPFKVRLANIDAPDKAQPFGAQSRQSLAELCLGKDASYQEQAIDHRGRTVAIVTCEGVEANRAQVERGMVWVYPKTNQDLTLPGLEAMARQRRVGLWVDAEPVAPWVFRHPKTRKIAKVPTENTDGGICFTDRHGEYRFVDGMKRYGC